MNSKFKTCEGCGENFTSLKKGLCKECTELKKKGGFEYPPDIAVIYNDDVKDEEEFHLN